MEVVPKVLLVEGKLPQIRFRRVDDPSSTPVAVQLSVWEDLVKQQIRTSVLVGHATLDPSVLYRMEVEGCERVFQMTPSSCSSNKQLLGEGKAWLTLGGRGWNTDTPETYAFLVVQYVSHHLRLGFTGLVQVATPQVAAGLLANDEYVSMVHKQQIVLLIWDFSIDPTKYSSIQLPGQNLVIMAMYGSRNVIGVWDVDEYLVLPSHKPFMHEATQGCLAGKLDSEQEAPIPFELAAIANWSDPAGEVAAWKRLGSFAAATAHANYTTRSYSDCRNGNLCKSAVDSGTDLTMHIHQLVQPPPMDVDRVPVQRACAYMLHFYSLWRRRAWKKASDDFLGPPLPLKLDDLPAPGEGGQQGPVGVV